jgi:hypothetical protein
MYKRLNEEVVSRPIYLQKKMEKKALLHQLDKAFDDARDH